eukprot:3738272-Amphidinium_carterae.1
MCRALSPSAEENVDMDISTPKGTGGLSPPPTAVGTRLDRPLGAALLAQANLGAGVETEHRTAVSSAALSAGGEAPDTARGRQAEPRPVRKSVLMLLGAGPPARRSRSRVPNLDGPLLVRPEGFLALTFSGRAQAVSSETCWLRSAAYSTLVRPGVLSPAAASTL